VVFCANPLLEPTPSLSPLPLDTMKLLVAVAWLNDCCILVALAIMDDDEGFGLFFDLENTVLTLNFNLKNSLSRFSCLTVGIHNATVTQNFQYPNRKLWPVGGEDASSTSSSTASQEVSLKLARTESSEAGSSKSLDDCRCEKTDFLGFRHGTRQVIILNMYQ